MLTDFELNDQILTAITPYIGKGRTVNRMKGLAVIEVLSAFLIAYGLNISLPNVSIEGIKHKSKRLIAFDLLS